MAADATRWAGHGGAEVIRRLLTYDETAAHLRCSVTSIRRLVREGALPCVRVTGRERRIREQDIERFVAERLQSAGRRTQRNRHAVTLRDGERLWD